jgi:hypothetical protein
LINVGSSPKSIKSAPRKAPLLSFGHREFADESSKIDPDDFDEFGSANINQRKSQFQK